ncbi:S-layer homology domain-containing protein [Bacillus mycoides]|nr:S-layer homology domain-containing protein [Bacillus mycoides]
MQYCMVAQSSKKKTSDPFPISFSFLSRYLWAVKLPPQNSAGAKKLGGSPAARKRPIGEG